ncbi:substrate-binding domain-containing protein [Maridesulfovibrio sp.]|uniref:substrate-binding domain-containing protein n=1 Tax=Maridesulfovibrio sp. TaxID=2795000 RepID=UPI002A1881DE|nr:substrate-binding domain-containing protein [Maridesulfovibrio sp.]
MFIPKATLPHFWRTVCMGAHTAVSDSNTRIIWRGPRVENKSDAQKHLIEFYTAKHVDAMVIAPAHKNRLNESIDKAIKAGIKVVIVDSRTSANRQDSLIATDNYQAGRIGAKILLEKTKGKGSLLLMGNVPDNGSISDREQGFIDAVHELSPGTTVIKLNTQEGTRMEAQLAAEEILQSSIPLSGIFSDSEVSSEGVLYALKKLGITGIPFVAFDYTEELLSALKTGLVDVVIAQTPFAMGYMGVRTAMELLEGKEVPATMKCPIKILTRENIDRNEILRCLRKADEEEKAACPICFN